MDKLKKLLTGASDRVFGRGIYILTITDPGAPQTAFGNSPRLKLAYERILARDMPSPSLTQAISDRVNFKSQRYLSCSVWGRGNAAHLAGAATSVPGIKVSISPGSSIWG